MHDNFQLYKENAAGVIWRNQQLTTNLYYKRVFPMLKREEKNISCVMFDKFSFSHFKQGLLQIHFFKNL